MTAGPYAVAPAAASALLHSLWQGALLAITAAITLAALQRRSAAVRHAVGLGFLLAMIAAPVVTFALYRQVPAAAPALGPMLSVPRGAVGPLMLRGSDWLVLAVPLAWMLGASVLLARQLGGWRTVARLDRRATGALPGGWVERVDILRRALGIGRAVAVGPGAGVSPFTARMVRPVIWLPAAVWPRLPLAQRDALLAHELAHVRRLDWLWNGLQSTVQALLFFHPAAWWLGRQIREDREHACDDLAVTTCGDPIALAEGLATLERQRRTAPGLVLAAQGGGSLLQRITRLLDDAATPARVPVRALIGLVVLLGAGTVVAQRLDLPRDAIIDLRIDGTPESTLTPGTFREITADAMNEQRYYRASMDGDGRVVEIYEEDGQPRPIGPDVRAWLRQLPSP